MQFFLNFRNNLGNEIWLIFLKIFFYNRENQIFERLIIHFYGFSFLLFEFIAEKKMIFRNLAPAPASLKKLSFIIQEPIESSHIQCNNVLLRVDNRYLYLLFNCAPLSCCVSMGTRAIIRMCGGFFLRGYIIIARNVNKNKNLFIFFLLQIEKCPRAEDVVC